MAAQEHLAFAGGVGMPELLIILVILILIFGGSRIPGIARALGKSVKEFKKGQHDDSPDTPDTPHENDSKDKG